MKIRNFAVFLQNHRVGQLGEDEHGRVAFAISDEYRHLPRRPVLSQSFEDDLERVYWGKRGRLPAFFANLIPEGPLREVLERAAGVPAGDDLGLLAAMGADLPGAVTVIESDDALQVDMDPSLATPNSHREHRDEDDEIPRFRFSLAGVQLKLSVLRREDKLALPAHGVDGDWIAKFHSNKLPGLAENEFSCLEWAREAGFDVPECHLHALDDLPEPIREYADPGTSVLTIRRYDRRDGGRIHQEDFAQVVGLLPERKYEHVTTDQLAALSRALSGLEALDEVVRRVVFLIACGNGDAHLKNWSLVYPDQMSARLSPLYDQVATVAWPRYDRELALKLAGIRDFRQIDAEALVRMARGIGADRDQVATLVADAKARIATAWQRIRGRIPMPPSHIDELREHWKRVPLLRDTSLATGRFAD